MSVRRLALFALWSAGCTLLFGDAPSKPGDDMMPPGSHDGGPHDGGPHDGGPHDGGPHDSGQGDLGECGPCTQPPAATCLDAAMVRRWVASGSCVSGSCAYVHFDVACTAGCVSGACVGQDPCDGVSCVSPPAPGCADPWTLRTYARSGTCSLGSCSYMPSEAHCSDGCTAGACVGDLCAGVACSDPPAPSCLDATTLVYSFPLGTCALGTCSYFTLEDHCPTGCVDGACAHDRCAGVSCLNAPGPTCLDVNTRRSYASPGTCSSGACSYAATDQSCTCMNGACCYGCVSGGACQSGEDNAACGSNGSACVACPGGSFCAGGMCTACVPRGGSCSGSGQCCNDGLCSFGGVCNACGGSGTFCYFTTDCCPTHTCSMNKCVLK